jgi:Tol biopolymer transport system component
MRRPPPMVALVLATSISVLVPLANAHAQTPGKMGRIAYEKNQRDLFSMLPTGASIKRISTIKAKESTAAYSPDGRRLAWRRITANGSAIVLAGADGSAPAKITAGSACDAGPTWSPDGSTIAFIRHASCSGSFATSQVWAYDVGTATLSMVTTLPGDAGHLAYAPDGRGLAFESNADGDDDIYVYDVVAGGTPMNLTAEAAADGVDDHPDWAPDGSSIAFRSTRSGGSNIWTMKPDGTAPTRVQTVGGDLPLYSPTGDWIVFQARGAGGDRDLYIVHPDGTGTIQVNPANEANETPTSWQPTCTLTATVGGTRTGTANDELLCGANGGETLNAGGGNDVVFGYAGGDTIVGGNGADVLVGGTGIDTLQGGDGNDWLNAADHGADTIVDGGAGNDVCVVDAGDGAVTQGCEHTIEV